MMRAENHALHKAETALGGVDVHETAKAYIFIARMAYCSMVCEFLADLFVRRFSSVIRCDLRLTRRYNLFAKCLSLDISDVK